MTDKSLVSDFYSGKTLFITGGTGFLGLCLIEKILRTLPDVQRIYLLMRPKKGKEISQRLETLTKDSIFETLLSTQSADVFKKLTAIAGDVGEEDLGLSAEDRKTLTDNVELVVHSAATLDFQQNLKPTVTINLLGTRRVTELCKEMTKIKVLVHVSSAYVNSFLLDTEEKLYPEPDDPDKIITMAKTLTDSALSELEKNRETFQQMQADPCFIPCNFYKIFSKYDHHKPIKIKPILRKRNIGFNSFFQNNSAVEYSLHSTVSLKLIGQHPNTYTFTKHLAEHEVNRASAKFSCAIVRPSMITAAWKEPVAGWTCSKNGPQGFLMGASRGIVRRLPIAKDLIADYIPVDVVVNQLLVSGYEASKRSSGLSIYHCTSSTCRPFTWSTVESKINGFLHKYPLKSAIWYPHLKFVSSIWYFKLCAIFIHFIPAYFLDLAIKLSGGRPILVRMHTNIWTSLDRLERFIFTEWKFDNTRTRELANSLTDRDKELFFIDISSLQWPEYFSNLTLGVRRYLNKEPMKTLPAALGKDTLLLVFHVILQVLIVFGGWYATSRVLGCTLNQSAWSAPLTYVLFSLL